MSKKHKREPITTVKPQPAICSCDQRKLCEEIKALRTRLKEAGNMAEANKRLYFTMLSKASRLSLTVCDLREAKDKVETDLCATKAESRYYRRAFKAMRIINVIFAVGFAVMTAILNWR